MNTPERNFWQAIRPAIPGFIQRIETLTGSGVPDVFVCCKGIAYWIELKVWVPGVGILLRKEQFAWGKAYATMGGLSFVLARNPETIKPLTMYLMNMRMVEVETYGTQEKYVRLKNVDKCIILNKKSELNGLPQKFLFT